MKTDKKSKKRYNYYRLCESYRLNGKPRHRTIISLGKIKKIKSNKERKLLADRIEELLSGETKIFNIQNKVHVENYAKQFFKKIVEQKLYDVKKEEVHSHISDF